MSEKRSVEIARRLAELGQTQKACDAYMLAIHEYGQTDPEIELEAAVYILQFEGDYRVAYTSFYNLYQRGLYQELCLGIMTEGFYDPNKEEQEKRYEENCGLLSRYGVKETTPFFEQLPIRFYPFNDKGFLPFYPAEGRFGRYTEFGLPVKTPVKLEEGQPVVLSEVYSQGDLDWLNSLPAGQEIQLHYPDWNLFCCALKVLDLRPLLERGNVTFTFGGEK